MSTEIAILGWAGLLAIAQLVALSVVANATMSTRYIAGPRDEEPRIPVLAGRVKRAFENHIEGLVMFAVAVLVTELGGASSPLSASCAVAYLAARLAYVPAYVAGVRYVRSAIWFVGFGATALMLAAAMLAGGANT